VSGVLQVLRLRARCIAKLLLPVLVIVWSGAGATLCPHEATESLPAHDPHVAAHGQDTHDHAHFHHGHGAHGSDQAHPDVLPGFAHDGVPGDDCVHVACPHCDRAGTRTAPSADVRSCIESVGDNEAPCTAPRPPPDVGSLLAAGCMLADLYDASGSARVDPPPDQTLLLSFPALHLRHCVFLN
jgi:hypothetical protein